MERPPFAPKNKLTVGWWEYPVIVLIAMSALPAYSALCMTIVAWGVLKSHAAVLGDMGGKLQARADVARFFAMAPAPVGFLICIIVSLANFRSRATKLGWLIMVGGFLAWCTAGLLIGRP